MGLFYTSKHSSASNDFSISNDFVDYVKTRMSCPTSGFNGTDKKVGNEIFHKTLVFQ